MHWTERAKMKSCYTFQFNMCKTRQVLKKEMNAWRLWTHTFLSPVWAGDFLARWHSPTIASRYILQLHILLSTVLVSRLSTGCIKCSKYKFHLHYTHSFTVICHDNHSYSGELHSVCCTKSCGGNILKFGFFVFFLTRWTTLMPCSLTCWGRWTSSLR